MQIRIPFIGGPLAGQSTTQMADWLINKAGALYHIVETGPCKVPQCYSFRGVAVPVQADRLLPCAPSPIIPEKP